ncbi:uncharacterized protein LOC116257383 isoform X5 [Nymphaea colorata]|nr:uncharacterized protein LOC116257383 isoform X5 [Nymphaea colorata]
MRAWLLLSASPFHPHAANPLRLSSPSSCSLLCSVPTVPANARTRKPPRRGVVLASTATPSRTQRIMETISLAGQGAGGAGGSYSYDALKRLDKLWLSICSSKPENFKPSEVVKRLDGSFWYSNDDKEISDKFDVLVCGGTLGVFIATALSLRGLKVGIVERDMVKGREQEWNISEKELRELVEAGILLENDIEQVTVAKFNPNRCGFEGKGDIWVEDILNLGVSPAKLIEVVKQRFINSGGTIYEGSSISTISVYDDSVLINFSEAEFLSARLLVDAMGNFSPIVKQVRSGKKPDGVCLVVGSCSRGFKNNKTSDVIFSSSSIRTIGKSKLQYFWEAFPAGSGPRDRTTYMFTYLDPKPGCPTLEQLLEDYWDLMPTYQGEGIEDIEILRVIFGIFPTYRDSSPLQTPFSRILQVGDASGIQSPVSFGGFGSITRNLNRLASGIYEALDGDFLDEASLSLLNPYMPNLSSSWLFQRAMSAQSDANVSSDFINELLYVNFQSMKKLGDAVLSPFLQDVVQFWPLAKTLGTIVLSHPQILPSIFKQVGIPVILDWLVHFTFLGYYTFLSTSPDPIVM